MVVRLAVVTTNTKAIPGFSTEAGGISGQARLGSRTGLRLPRGRGMWDRPGAHGAAGRLRAGTLRARRGLRRWGAGHASAARLLGPIVLPVPQFAHL